MKQSLFSHKAFHADSGSRLTDQFATTRPACWLSSGSHCPRFVHLLIRMNSRPTLTISPYKPLIHFPALVGCCSLHPLKYQQLLLLLKRTPFWGNVILFQMFQLQLLYRTQPGRCSVTKLSIKQLLGFISWTPVLLYGSQPSWQQGTPSPALHRGTPKELYLSSHKHKSTVNFSTAPG